MVGRNFVCLFVLEWKNVFYLLTGKLKEKSFINIITDLSYF